MKEKNKRNIKMQVYLTKEEFDKIITFSTRAGISISTFARRVCLGSKVESREDVHARQELRKINADLGRLGGLLKLAITQDNRVTINGLLRDIDRTKDALKRKIDRL